MSKKENATNNKYFYFPPIMSDGRLYTSWQPGAVVSENIKKENNIHTNADYRKFMMGNADTIIKKNQKNACNVTGYCPYNMDNSVSLNSGEIVGESIINSNNVNGLKQKYLARHELESRMKAPYLSQEELLRGGFLNPN